MTNLNSGVKSCIDAFVTRLGEAGVSAEDADAVLKDPRLAIVMAEALHKELRARRKIGRSLGTVSLVPQSADEAIAALESEGFRISDWARGILKLMPPADTGNARTVELVEVTVAEIGLASAAQFDEICAQAKEHGLELCPAGVGPALRSNLFTQQPNHWLLVAMEPIADSGGVLNVWGLIRESDGLWFDSGFGRACQWGPDTPFVFVRSV